MVAKFRGIALSGKAGAGKDTIADAICRILPAAYPVKLATPIYEEAYERGMDPRVKDRPLLQRIGDDHTSIDPTYYPRLLVERVRDTSVQGSMVFNGFPVVTDMRKRIELLYLQQVGFFCVRVEASTDMRIVRLLERDGAVNHGSLSHWTETDLDQSYDWFNLVVYNGRDSSVERQASDIVTAVRFQNER